MLTCFCFLPIRIHSFSCFDVRCAFGRASLRVVRCCCCVLLFILFTQRSTRIQITKLWQFSNAATGQPGVFIYAVIPMGVKNAKTPQQGEGWLRIKRSRSPWNWEWLYCLNAKWVFAGSCSACLQPARFNHRHTSTVIAAIFACHGLPLSQAALFPMLWVFWVWVYAGCLLFFGISNEIFLFTPSSAVRTLLRLVKL